MNGALKISSPLLITVDKLSQSRDQKLCLQSFPMKLGIFEAIRRD